MTQPKKSRKSLKRTFKISRTTRVARAGESLGKSLVETVHLLYLNDNAMEFLQTLRETLAKEFNRRQKEWKKLYAKKSRD